MYTFSVLFKKEAASPYYSQDVFNSGADWDFTWRSAAGIHPWSAGNMSDYWAGVYGIHYWYNTNTAQTETRYRYISQSCDILNWGVNNW